MKESAIVVPYDESWPEEFRAIGSKLRSALGDEAVRIDHIGSTAVPGLDAKPIIDIQISVRALEPMTYKGGLEAAGYVHRADNPDRTKRYFREGPGLKRTHIHVREAGSWSEQFALLFRDFLKAHNEYRELYVREKYTLVRRYSRPHERELYVEGKDPVIWRIMREASGWSQRTGWKPEAGDA
ncbi:GrpB family protein [Saccharibacillus sp. CPCC 101409]|uniref:GrpB family protein n=1 Tax=Saccharibacillus sp. CPCC 101409 TaxID=3058041 RepID=UPI002673A210|nr:GrpB family protein [Saccharibacillus sp. CPCC 101409]MDO3410532.1 GrpB family protein [Saccharibacillus sp. CPCC 101409]